jgi:hypothetical protein
MGKFLKFKFDPRTRNSSEMHLLAKKVIPKAPVLKIAQHGAKASVGRVAFWTHEATSYVVRAEDGKKLFLRVPNTEHDLIHSVFSPVDTRAHAVRDYARMKLFNIMFPKNSINPVGLAEVDFGGAKAFGVLSEIIKGRSQDYKKHHTGVYNSKETPTDAHSRFVKGKEVTELIGEIKKAGFSFEGHSWNIMNAQGRPVLLEIEHVDSKKLLAYIKKPTNSKRMRSFVFEQRVKNLLDMIENTKVESKERIRFPLG